MSVRIFNLAFALLFPTLATSMLLAGWPGQATAQDMRRIAVIVNSIRIEDEDDPLSDDEPYLVMTRFVGRLQFAGGTFAVDPRTLQVSNVMSGHNDLGRRGDNWADEVRTYSIPQGTPRVAQALVPMNEPGWFVGAVIFHLEEDGFADSTATLLGNRLRQTVQETLTGMRFGGFDSSAISSAVASRIRRDLRSSLSRLSIPGIIRGLASAADPDDVGGYHLVFGITAPGNTVMANTAESPTDTGALLTGASAVSGSRPFALRYPAGDLRSIPSNTRFQGRHRVNGVIEISTTRF